MDHSWRSIFFSIVDIIASAVGLASCFFLSAAYLGPYLGSLSPLPILIAAPFFLALRFDLTQRETAVAAGALTVYKVLLWIASVFIFGAGA